LEDKYTQKKKVDCSNDEVKFTKFGVSYSVIFLKILFWEFPRHLNWLNDYYKPDNQLNDNLYFEVFEPGKQRQSLKH